MTFDDLTDEFDALVRHQDERDRAYTWPVEHHPTDRASRTTLLAEHREWGAYDVWAAKQRGETLPVHKRGFPDNAALIARVLAEPDADAPRLEYARWHRTQPTAPSRDVADFVEGQVRLAAALRRDPHARPAEVLAPYAHAFARPNVPAWWRHPSGGITGLSGALAESTAILLREGLVVDRAFFRGFVEHVAMRASRFLELADELFALAPIRHLTLTYCKGLDHTDTGLLDALLASPHLDRIRSLQLPGRVTNNPHTRLNVLTDDDLARIAASPRVGTLGYLAFCDQAELTVRGFDALAASRALLALRIVRHDLYRYFRVAGDYGDHQRELAESGLARFALELLARHPQVAWLHPLETEAEIEATDQRVVG